MCSFALRRHVVRGTLACGITTRRGVGSEDIRERGIPLVALRRAVSTLVVLVIIGHFVVLSSNQYCSQQEPSVGERNKQLERPLG